MNESLKEDIKSESREDLERLFLEEVEVCDILYDKIYKMRDEIDRLNAVLGYLEKYFSDREYYEFADKVREIKQANIEWLENAINNKEKDNER